MSDKRSNVSRAVLQTRRHSVAVKKKKKKKKLSGESVDLPVDPLLLQVVWGLPLRLREKLSHPGGA